MFALRKDYPMPNFCSSEPPPRLPFSAPAMILCGIGFGGRHCPRRSLSVTFDMTSMARHRLVCPLRVFGVKPGSNRGQTGVKP